MCSYPSSAVRNHKSLIGMFRMGISNLVWLLFTVNTTSFVIVAALLLIMETFICRFVIQNVSYTEIDWSTYMQQVDCYSQGIRNYSLIKGDTGPVVYPAGHIFVYWILKNLTANGKDILRAQYIFMGLYLLFLLMIFITYHKTRKVPPFVLFLICCTSYRVHSIFLLRLFNDPIAMLLFFIGLNFWLHQQWLIGCICYSAAVSVKMNILLFAPAVFFIVLFNNGPGKTFVYILICGLIQLIVALPFVIYDPVSYVKRSFDLGRVFFYKWTVNWRFLPENVFLDKRFHLTLLFFHIVILILFCIFIWFRTHGGTLALVKRTVGGIRTRITADETVFALFTANLIGICVARSLHYQFYSWYYHSIPYLLFATLNFEVKDSEMKTSQSASRRSEGIAHLPWLAIILRIAIMLGIELCWNSYPSTKFSSFMLHIFHVSLLLIVVQYATNIRSMVKTKSKFS